MPGIFMSSLTSIVLCTLWAPNKTLLNCIEGIKLILISFSHTECEFHVSKYIFSSL